MRWLELFGGVVLVVSPVCWGQTALTNLRTWGLTTATNIQNDFSLPSSALYAEIDSLSGVQSGGANGKAFVWTEATQMRVLDDLAEMNPTVYDPILLNFSNQVYASYWNNGYTAEAGGSDRYYDDNAHMVVSLALAYQVTKSRVYLARAESAEAFVLSGTDTVDAPAGGIYFEQGGSTLTTNSISTLQGARGAAMLYQDTGDVDYLNDASSLLNYADAHMESSSGLYAQSYSPTTNTMGEPPLANASGIAISMDVEMYDITGSKSYLTAAEKTATGSETAFFNARTGGMTNAGEWTFELADGLDSLSMADGNQLWLNDVINALDYLHNDVADPNGNFPLTWDTPQTTPLATWDLIDQASADDAFLFTSLVPEPGMFSILVVGAALALRRRRRVLS